jgi:hypothetical protein
VLQIPSGCARTEQAVSNSLPGLGLGASLLVVEALEVRDDVQGGRVGLAGVPLTKLLDRLVKLRIDVIRREVIRFTSHSACFLPGSWSSGTAV